MISYNTQVRLEAAVNDFCSKNKMFTAGEIIALVRSSHPSVTERYAPMRDHIHSLFHAGRMAPQYEKTSVAFLTSKGLDSAFVYHPDDVDPAKYESHETRKNTSTGSISSPPTPTTGFFVSDSFGSTGPLPDALTLLFGANSGPQQTFTCCGGSTAAAAPSVVPLRKPTVTGAPEIVYSIDAAGQIVIGKDYTSQLVKTHLSSLYALAERKRVTLVNAADSHSANVTILTLDDNWNARVPQSTLSKAGLDGKRLTITVEDDAIYITEKK